MDLMLFSAPWCGPCKTMKPIVKEVVSDFKNVELVEVNIDEDGDSAISYGIRSIPTLILLKDGEKVDSLIGGHSAEELKEFLSNNS